MQKNKKLKYKRNRIIATIRKNDPERFRSRVVESKKHKKKNRNQELQSAIKEGSDGSFSHFRVSEVVLIWGYSLS